MSTPPIWIRTPRELEALARQLDGVRAVAIDTEADSLHHYPERLCLIQLADPEGRVYLLDPLALPDLDALRAVCRDPATLKVFHSADNDLAHLKRRFGLTFVAIGDTMFAARFLGVRELGLDRLLGKYLDVHAVKSQQKTDWARRPLTPAQEEYAAADVCHLIALHGHLLGELRALGREAWLVEECEAAAAAPPPPARAADEDPARRVRGASRLDERGLSVLRALHAQRETWARAEHRPPFKVLSPETLVALAAARPVESTALVGIRGLSPRLVERYGRGILEAVTRGLAQPIWHPPRSRRAPPAVPVTVRQSAQALRRWRAATAERTGLDPGVLLPQRLIDALAAAPPTDRAGLAQVPGLRRWRIETFGPELLAALRAAAAAPTGESRETAPARTGSR